MYRNEKNKNQKGFLDIVSAITLAFLLVGITATTYLTQQKQDIRKFAMQDAGPGGGGVDLESDNSPNSSGSPDDRGTLPNTPASDDTNSEDYGTRHPEGPPGGIGTQPAPVGPEEPYPEGFEVPPPSGIGGTSTTPSTKTYEFPQSATLSLSSSFPVDNLPGISASIPIGGNTVSYVSPNNIPVDCDQACMDTINQQTLMLGVGAPLVVAAVVTAPFWVPEVVAVGGTVYTAVGLSTPVLGTYVVGSQIIAENPQIVTYGIPAVTIADATVKTIQTSSGNQVQPPGTSGAPPIVKAVQTAQQLPGIISAINGGVSSEPSTPTSSGGIIITDQNGVQIQPVIDANGNVAVIDPASGQVISGGLNTNINTSRPMTQDEYNNYLAAKNSLTSK